MGAESARSISAFRAFRTQLRDAFAVYRSPYVSIDVLLTWGTTRFGTVTVRHDPRAVGVSNYTFRKLLVHALNMVTGFSTWPLQMAGMVGFFFTLFGIGILVYVLGRYYRPGRQRRGLSVPGLGDRPLLGGAALRAGDFRRISRPDAFSDDGTAHLRCAG